jgi:7-cyano-7-deazaguanine synthase
MGTDNRPLAVVLLSGGMDSAVAAAEVARTHRLACLHASYGQLTANRERVSFGALAHHFQAAAKLAIRLDHLGVIGGSALTDPAIPVADAADQPAGIPATYVPFRNSHLLAAAVSWAEVLGARQVVIGAVEADSSGYPDCRQVFYDAFTAVIRLGTRPDTDLELVTPVIGASKADIVRRGRELGTPFHLTWSCYREESRACGRCESCVLRLRGFAAAGLHDPIPYAAGVDLQPAAAPAEDGAPRRRIRALEQFLHKVRRG